MAGQINWSALNIDSDVTACQEAMEVAFKSTWSADFTNDRSAHMEISSIPVSDFQVTKTVISAVELNHSAEQPGDSNMVLVHYATEPQRICVRNKWFDFAPRDIAVLDSKTPCRVITKAPYTTFGFAFNAKCLERLVPSLPLEAGIFLRRDEPLGRPLSFMLESIWEVGQTRLGERALELTARTFFDSLVSACSIINRSSPVASRSQIDARIDRIETFVLRNIECPELSVSSIADHFSISTRRLQMLMAPSGRRLSTMIRDYRLDLCKNRLSDPAFAGHSISEIAFSSGFNNMSHFAKAFRDGVGCSARDFRWHATVDHDAPLGL